jgi:hypothetical protein
MGNSSGWGKAEKIDAAVKAESEKAADYRLQKARGLVTDKKPVDAKKLSERLVELFPNTRAAGDAKNLLAKLEK